MPIFLIPFFIVHAKQAHAMDRSVDVQRQQYALQVAQFNLEHHTNIVPTKKGVIIYDAKTKSVSTQDINDTYHRQGK